ncbi:probable helicase with zinc finger domain [Bolinopsis microptera]|uniref:probable helicase with zinc finger domain n=1 Tax=Bolinopsis microptera TaxID=2820187 RepID=UPI00307A5E51
MSSQMITVCQICWKMTNHKTNPTLTTADKVKKDKNDKQNCQVCCQIWSPVQLVKNNGKWIYIRPRPANVPGEFKMCDKKGKCIKGASCTFAHSKEELESWNREREGPPMPDKPRPAPLISGNRYMMCTHHSNGKRCLYGADCKFAHSQEELDLWNATIVTRSGDGTHNTSRANSFSLDTTPPENKHSITSPIRQYSDETKRIIPGLHTNTTKPSSNNRTRLSSLSSNASNTSDHMTSSKNLPVSLTLSHNNKESTITSVFRCDTCDCTCTSMKQLLEHKAGAKHKQIARCNSFPDEPTIRPRPILNSRGIQEYSICKSVNESGRCKFGTGCPEAHSYEELEAWNSQLNNSIQALIPSKEDVIPFLEKIRRELDSTELTISDLLQPKFGISIEEVSGTRLEINHTGASNLKWIFRTTVKESCQLLGMIMLGEQYPQFTFTALTISTATVHPTTTPYAIEAKHSLYPGDSFTTQVEFKQQTGCFPQVVVFKFNGFFMGTLLKVTSMSEESFELQNLHRHVTETQSSGAVASNWDTVVQVISLDGADLKERDQCPDEYPLSPDCIRVENLSQNLTMLTYKMQLHTLLYIEEMERQKVLATSHLPNMACEVTPGYRDEYMYHCAPQGFGYLTFLLDDLADNSPQLIMRNKICEVKAANSNVAYQGILEMIGRESLVVRVKDECAKLCKKDKASVRFTQKRKDFKYMHYAIDHVSLNLMFPDYSPDRSSKPEELAMLLDKTNLNKAQRGVIEDILDPFTSHIPTLVCGPFGTGKTSTLVEAVSILLQVNTMSRILVCTHSNSAADIYIERLDKKFGSEFLRGKVLRHFYHERKQTTIKPLLLKYTYIVTTNYGGKFELPPLPQLKELSVIVTTIEQSGDLAYYPGLEPGHFTHIFIDEAAQEEIDDSVFFSAGRCQENKLLMSAHCYLTLSQTTNYFHWDLHIYKKRRNNLSLLYGKNDMR